MPPRKTFPDYKKVHVARLTSIFKFYKWEKPLMKKYSLFTTRFAVCSVLYPQPKMKKHPIQFHQHYRHYLTKWREPMCRVPERRLHRSQPAGLAPCLWCRSRWWSWGSRGSSASPATAGSWPPWWKAPSDERRWQRRWFSPCRPIWAAPSWPEEEEEERAEHR